MTFEIVKGQPLTLPDGTVVLPDVDPDTGSKVVTKEELEAEAEIKDALDEPMDNDYTQLYQRTLADVSVEHQRMNAIMLMVGYTMWGLNIHAIARLMNVDAETVERIQDIDLFQETKTQLIEAIRYAETATVHGYLASQAHKAARVVAATLANPSGDLKLAAAKDILD